MEEIGPARGWPESEREGLMSEKEFHWPANEEFHNSSQKKGDVHQGSQIRENNNSN